MTTNRISSDAYTTGLIAGLAHLNVKTINVSHPKFYPASLEAFQTFESIVQSEGYNLRFWFTIDQLHGDAPEIKQALLRASLRGLVFFSDNHMFLDIDKDETHLYFRNLPGEAGFYIQAAKMFLTYDETLATYMPRSVNFS